DIDLNIGPSIRGDRTVIEIEEFLHTIDRDLDAFSVNKEGVSVRLTVNLSGSRKAATYGRSDIPRRHDSTCDRGRRPCRLRHIVLRLHQFAVENRSLVAAILGQLRQVGLLVDAVG